MGECILSRSNPTVSGERVGDVRVSYRKTLGDKWALANGSPCPEGTPGSIPADILNADCWKTLNIPVTEYFNPEDLYALDDPVPYVYIHDSYTYWDGNNTWYRIVTGNPNDGPGDCNSTHFSVMKIEYDGSTLKYTRLISNYLMAIDGSLGGLDNYIPIIGCCDSGDLICGLVSISYKNTMYTFILEKNNNNEYYITSTRIINFPVTDGIHSLSQMQAVKNKIIALSAWGGGEENYINIISYDQNTRNINYEYEFRESYEEEDSVQLVTNVLFDQAIVIGYDRVWQITSDGSIIRHEAVLTKMSNNSELRGNSRFYEDRLCDIKWSCIYFLDTDRYTYGDNGWECTGRLAYCYIAWLGDYDTDAYICTIDFSGNTIYADAYLFNDINNIGYYTSEFISYKNKLYLKCDTMLKPIYINYGTLPNGDQRHASHCNSFDSTDYGGEGNPADCDGYFLNCIAISDDNIEIANPIPSGSFNPPSGFESDGDPSDGNWYDLGYYIYSGRNACAFDGKSSYMTTSLPTLSLADNAYTFIKIKE